MIFIHIRTHKHQITPSDIYGLYNKIEFHVVGIFFLSVSIQFNLIQ